MLEWIDMTFGGETLRLLPDRALLRVERHDLVVADIHLGKPETFRVHGSPIPESVTTRDLERLSALIHTHAPRRLVILGDLLHSRHGATNVLFDAVERWRARHPDLAILLVRGNHDRRSGAVPLDLGFTVVDPPFDDGLFLLHEPEGAPSGGHSLAGHLHPCARAPGVHLRGPCFWVSGRRCVLPAFGTFTGSCSITGRGDDIVVVCAREGLAPASPRAAACWRSSEAHAATATTPALAAMAATAVAAAHAASLVER